MGVIYHDVLHCSPPVGVPPHDDSRESIDWFDYRAYGNEPNMLNYAFNYCTNQHHITMSVAGILPMADMIDRDILLLEHKEEKGLHHKSHSFAEVTR